MHFGVALLHLAIHYLGKNVSYLFSLSDFCVFVNWLGNEEDWGTVCKYKSFVLTLNQCGTHALSS